MKVSRVTPTSKQHQDSLKSACKDEDHHAEDTYDEVDVRYKIDEVQHDVADDEELMRKKVYKMIPSST